MPASIRGNLYHVCLLGVEVTKKNKKNAAAGNINIQAELPLSIS